MKKTISIPNPRLLDNGKYVGQVMSNGKRELIYGDTLAEYQSNVLAYKKTKHTKTDIHKQTLEQLLTTYINKNETVLSPETIRSYDVIVKNRFKDYIDKSIDKIDWQEMVNKECLIYSPKTVRNSWSLVSASLKDIGVNVTVKKPKKPISNKPFLDPEQIKVFMSAIRGTDVELPALLALHSLRVSEILPLTSADVKDNIIRINKSEIRSKYEEHLLTNHNKTKRSTRDIPIFIERLTELLPESGKLVNIRAITINRRLRIICEKNKLPVITCHDLRRSFCSLGFFLGLNEQTVMQIGGWSNMQTVNNVYRKLAQQQRNSDIEKLVNYYKTTK